MRFCILVLSLLCSVSTGTSVSTSASTPSPFVAGYGIQTSPTVDLAASDGVQIAHPFATLSRLEIIDPSALTEMRNRHMHMVSTDLLHDVDDWACWHEWTFVGPGSDYCSGVLPAYSGFGSDAAGQQGADNTLVSAITSDLNAVNSSGNADLVSYFTILDTWPARDPGSGQQILPEVNSLIHSITPGKQSICSFPFAYLVPLKNFEPYAGWLDVNHQGGPIQNFSPSGCDNVAVYGYAQRSPSNPTLFTATDYDWTMSKVLQPWINALIRVGGAADPGWNGPVNFIGVGQIFGEDTTASGNYFLVPLLDSASARSLGVPVYQPILDQETAFCRAGMSIMPFSWELSSSQYPYVQTPSNNADIEAGIQAAVADCHVIWQGTTTTTLASSSPSSQSTYGENVTLTASVTAGTTTPTGTVNVFDGQTQIGTAVLSNGKAAITTSELTAGTHTISGVYTPNQSGDFVTSTSAAITQAVGPAPLTITASSIAAPYGAAMPVILPSYAGLQNGDFAPAVSPTCATTAAPGSDTGAYPTNCTGASDPNYTISYEPGSIAIVPAGTTTAINSSSLDNSSIYGDPVILSATVSASFGTPNGSITFRAGRSPLQSVSLAGGAASYTTTALMAGRRRILAVYDPSSNAEGSNNYAPSSISLRFRVRPAPLVIGAASPTITYGRRVPAIRAVYYALRNGDKRLRHPPTCGATDAPRRASPPAGDYPTLCSGAKDGDYKISYIAGDLHVHPARLIITARNETVLRGGPLPVLRWSAHFKNHDRRSSLAEQPTCSTQAILDSSARVISRPGRYVISCSSALDPNYKIRYVDATLSVRR